MRVITLIVAFCATSALTAVPVRGDGVSWFEADGSLRWHRELDASNGARTSEPTSLSVETWYPRLPDAEFRKTDDTPVSTRELDGEVLIVAFWASWCQPCREELPTIEALRRTLGEQRIGVLAVNLRESVPVAEGFLESIGVDLPVAISTPRAEREFKIQSVPVVIVADSERRVRGRWNGFHESTLEELSARVRELLSGENEPTFELARVEHGQGLLVPRWMREGNGTIDHAGAASTGEPGVLAVAGRTIYDYAADGFVTRFRTVSFAPSRLVEHDVDGDGLVEILGFRPGGKRLVAYDRELEVLHDAALEVPMIDVAAHPGTGRILFASLDGIHEVELADATSRLVRESEAVMELATLDGSPTRLIGRTSSGALEWFDEALASADGPEIEASVLVADPLRQGFAVLERPAPTAIGRFLPGGERQFAVASGGHLRVLELSDATERFRAAWPGISGLVAIDIDGDGQDELAVASGDRLVMLGSTIVEK